MRLLSIYIIYTLPLILCYGYTRFTNINCECWHNLCTMSVCNLKVLGRGIVGANVHVTNPSPAMKAIKVNLSLWRKHNGYHPFLFNVTVDFCHFMRHPNPSNVFYYWYRGFKSFANYNHSCPYDVSRTEERGEARMNFINFILYFSMILLLRTL